MALIQLSPDQTAKYTAALDQFRRSMGREPLAPDRLEAFQYARSTDPWIRCSTPAWWPSG
jgi:hypothetical protein